MCMIWSTAGQGHKASQGLRRCSAQRNRRVRTSTMCRSMGPSGRCTSATASTTMSVSCAVTAWRQLRAALAQRSRAFATRLVGQLRVQLGAQRGACHLERDVALRHAASHLHRHLELRRKLKRNLLGNVEALAAEGGGGAARGGSASAAQMQSRACRGGCPVTPQRGRVRGARLADDARVEALSKVALRLAHQLACGAA